MLAVGKNPLSKRKSEYVREVEADAQEIAVPVDAITTAFDFSSLEEYDPSIREC